MPSWLRSSSGTLSATATSQRLMNSEATEATDGVEAGLDAALEAAHEGVGGGEVLLASRTAA